MISIKYTLRKTWKVFQDKVRNSPFLARLRIVAQPTLSNGKRPDYIGLSKEKPREVTAIVDAKDVAVLTKENIKQVAGYKETIKKEQNKAPEAAIVIPKRTRVPRTVRVHAEDEDIEIIRHRGRQRIRAYG